VLTSTSFTCKQQQLLPTMAVAFGHSGPAESGQLKDETTAISSEDKFSSTNSTATVTISEADVAGGGGGDSKSSTSSSSSSSSTSSASCSMSMSTTDNQTKGQGSGPTGRRALEEDDEVTEAAADAAAPRRPTPQQDKFPLVSPIGLKRSKEECQATDLQMDFNFRCNFCIRLIGPDGSAFMRNDLTYCSSTCRKKGRSKLYTNLRSLQLERVREKMGKYSCPSETGTSLLSTAFSDSDVASNATSERNPGALIWMLGKVIDVISARIPAPIVHAASTAVLDRLSPGGPLHRLLNYIPEAHSFLALPDSPTLSRVGSSLS